MVSEVLGKQAPDIEGVGSGELRKEESSMRPDTPSPVSRLWLKQQMSSVYMHNPYVSWEVRFEDRLICIQRRQ